MPPASDPYRTLGLDPAATPAEIKRAYRRLAKAYHPDSAGERALPRFLAIQAAYERLTSGQPGGRPPARDGSARRGAAPSPPAPPPSRPWSADAERARAARDAFRKRSTRTGARSSPGTTGPGGSASPSEGSGPTGPGGPAGSGSPGGARPGRGSRRGRPKATIGSTSYDGTEGEPFEPGWSGAGWYGAASGTYWTINPKEYADPRKHGPEYLARARRSPTGAPGSAEAVGGVASEAGARRDARDTTPAAGPPPPASPEGGGRPPASTRAGSAGSDATAGSARAAARSQPTIRRSRPATPATPASPRTEPISRPSALHAAPAPAHPARFAGIEPARIVGSWRGRLFLAGLAWFPIGLAIFGIHGQLTGCSRFLASCSDPVAWSVWIPQLIVFALLVFSPRLAWIAASGSIVLLCLTVPLAAVLTAGSGGRPPSVATTELLYTAMTAGWLVGVGIAASGRIPLPPWRVARVR